MNKRDLVDVLVDRTGLEKQAVIKTIEAFVLTVEDTMAKNERIRIRGLGVFYPIVQTTRLVRNPKTGEEMMFTPRNSFRFKPGEDVVKKLNKE